MIATNEKGIAQLFLVAAFAFAVLTLSGAVFYKTVRSSNNVQGYSISQLLPKTTAPVTNMPCTKEMMVCSATPKKCCTGYILRGCTTFNGVAKDSPFEAVKGTVCIRNSGTPNTPRPTPLTPGQVCSRSPRCTASDKVACCAGFEASTDGCASASVKRCLPKDTDKDGIPDLWDDDADGDGILKKDDPDDDGDGVPDVDEATGRPKGFPEDPRIYIRPNTPLPLQGQKPTPIGPITTPKPLTQ